jgi:hypothetical protein
MNAIDPQSLSADWSYPTRGRFGSGRVVSTKKVASGLSGGAMKPRHLDLRVRERESALGELDLGLVQVANVDPLGGVRPLGRHEQSGQRCRRREQVAAPSESDLGASFGAFACAASRCRA